MVCWAVNYDNIATHQHTTLQMDLCLCTQVSIMSKRYMNGALHVTATRQQNFWPNDFYIFLFISFTLQFSFLTPFSLPFLVFMPLLLFLFFSVFFFSFIPSTSFLLFPLFPCHFILFYLTFSSFMRLDCSLSLLSPFFFSITLLIFFYFCSLPLLCLISIVYLSTPRS